VSELEFELLELLELELLFDDLSSFFSGIVGVSRLIFCIKLKFVSFSFSRFCLIKTGVGDALALGLLASSTFRGVFRSDLSDSFSFLFRDLVIDDKLDRFELVALLLMLIVLLFLSGDSVN
jgi:hypothetical protein